MTKRIVQNMDVILADFVVNFTKGGKQKMMKFVPEAIRPGVWASGDAKRTEEKIKKKMDIFSSGQRRINK